MNAKVVLEREDEIIAIAYGYIQQKVNSKFTPVAIGLTKTSILVYDDSKADSYEDNILSYNVKKEIPAKSIKLATKQKYINGERKGYTRIIFDMKGDADPFIVSFRKKDYKVMNHFFKSLSSTTNVNTKTVKTKNRSVINDMKKI